MATYGEGLSFGYTWKSLLLCLTQSPSAMVGGITFSQVAHSMSCFASCQAEVHRELKQMLKYLLNGSRRLNEHDVICILYTLRRLAVTLQGDALVTGYSDPPRPLCRHWDFLRVKFFSCLVVSAIPSRHARALVLFLSTVRGRCFLAVESILCLG